MLGRDSTANDVLGATGRKRRDSMEKDGKGRDGSWWDGIGVTVRHRTKGVICFVTVSRNCAGLRQVN